MEKYKKMFSKIVKCLLSFLLIAVYLPYSPVVKKINAAVERLTPSDAGRTLSSGTYELPAGTYQPHKSLNTSGFTIQENSIVTFILTGGTASVIASQNYDSLGVVTGAGINLPESSTLILRGNGVLDAKSMGSMADIGKNGETEGAAHEQELGELPSHANGDGGDGGKGGNGISAAIGGLGGEGGNPNGNDGRNGQNCGNLFVLGTVIVTTSTTQNFGAGTTGGKGGFYSLRWGRTDLAHDWAYGGAGGGGAGGAGGDGIGFGGGAGGGGGGQSGQNGEYSGVETNWEKVKAGVGSAGKGGLGVDEKNGADGNNGASGYKSSSVIANSNRGPGRPGNGGAGGKLYVSTRAKYYGTKGGGNGAVDGKSTIERIAYDINDMSIPLNPSSYIYDGTQKTPNYTPTAILDGRTFTMAEVTPKLYEDNINAGTGKVTVESNEIIDTNAEYIVTGEERALNFTINRADLVLGLEYSPPPPFTYGKGFVANLSGNIETGRVTWSAASGSADYVATANTNVVNVKPRTNSLSTRVRVAQTANYNAADKTFGLETINKKEVNALQIVAIAPQKYTGNPIKPKPTVTDPDVYGTSIVLREGTDYQLIYNNNINTGNNTAEVKIQGLGMYTGIRTLNFSITRVPMSETAIRITSPNVVYNGSNQISKPTLSYNGQTLLEGRDYTIQQADGRDNTNISINGNHAGVTLVGMGNFSGERSIDFDITPETMNVSNTNLVISKNPENVVFNGVNQTSSKPTLTYRGKTLKEGTDYTLTYSGSIKEVGSATITITGINNFKDARTTTYQITPATLKIKANTNQGKSFGTQDPDVLTYSYSGNFAGFTPVFTGALVRDAGEELGNYPIKQGTLAFDLNANVNRNYAWNYTGTNFVISEFSVSEQASLEGVMGKNDWYTNTVKIIAPNGYKISASNSLINNTWNDFITNPDGDYSKGTTYFMKRNSDQAITKAMTISYKQDTKKPNGSIVIGTSLWSQFLQNITFNMFFNSEIKADIFGDDILSGIDKISYVESDKELTFDELNDIPNEFVEGKDYVWSDSVPAYLKKEKAIVYARIMDKAGHFIYISTDGIILDKDKPELSAQYEFDDVWTNKEEIVINGKALDSLSGFKDRYLTYTREGQKSQLINTEGDGTFKIEFLPDGAYGVLIEGMDKAGNLADSITIHVKKDSVIPKLALQGDTVNIKKNQKITFNPILGSSPVANIEYFKTDKNGENGTWVEVENAMQDGYIATQNNVKYQFRVTNAAGSVSDPVSMSFSNIDAAKPIVNATAYVGSSEDDVYTSGDWTNQEVHINFTNKTVNRGESKFEMKLDDGSFQEVPTTNGQASLSMASEGKHTFTLRITSKGGVVSDDVSFEVNIDKSAPNVKVDVNNIITTQILNIVTFDQMFKDSQQVKIVGNDLEVNGAKSEVNEINYFVLASKDDKKLVNYPTTISEIERIAKSKWMEGNQLTIDPNRTYIVYAKVSDHAGNLTYASSNGLLLDDKSPEIDIVYEANGMWTHDARIDGHVNDALSGVKNLYYQVDEETKVESSLRDGVFSVGSFDDGKHSVRFEALDALGNLAFSNTIEVWQDNIEPTIEINGQDELGASAQVDIDALHSGPSKLAKVEVKIDDGEWQNITDKNQGTYTVVENGVYTFRATSGAGKKSEVSMTFGRIFAQGIEPVIEVEDHSGKKIKNGGWASSEVIVKMHNNPANVSGLKYYYRSKDSGVWTQAEQVVKGVVKINVDTIGHHHYEFKVALADNSIDSDVVTFDFDIEKTLPQGSITLEEDTNNAWQNFLEVITFQQFFKKGQWFNITATDNESGLDESSIQYFKRESAEHEKLNQNVVTATDIEAFVDGRWVDGNRGFLDLNHAYVIYAKIVDKAGNTLYLSSDGIIIDDTKPQISTSFDSNQWIIDDTTPITVNVKETLSDFDFNAGSVTYKINDTNKEVQSLQDGSFDISMNELQEGINIITIDAQDKSENRAETYQSVAKKDTLVPSLVVIPENLIDVSAQNILTITPTVGASGVKKMEILFPGETTWRDITDDYEDGYPARVNGIYRIRLTNGAGVRANASVALSNLDSLQPIISVSAIDSSGSPYTSGTWHKKDVSISFSNLANNEGTSTYAYRIGREGDFTQVQPNDYGVATFDVISEGANDVYLQITSRTGVTNEETIFEVNKDISGPQLNVETMSVITNFQIITLQAIDDGVGLDPMQAYSFDGGKTWTNQNAKEFEDNKTIKVAVRDALGNITQQDVNVRLDNVPPFIDNAKQNTDDWATSKLVSADIQDVSDDDGIALISQVQSAFMTAKNPYKEGELTRKKPSNSDYVLQLEDDSKWSTNQEITDLLGLSMGDNYWIVASDNAENASSTSLKVDKIFYETDPEDPEKPVDPDKPVDPVKPVDPDKPGGGTDKPGGGTDKPDKPSKPNKPVKPDESDDEDDLIDDNGKPSGGNDKPSGGKETPGNIDEIENKIKETTTKEEIVTIYVDYLKKYVDSGTLSENEIAIINSTIDELLSLKDEKEIQKVLDKLSKSDIKDKDILGLLDQLGSNINKKAESSNALSQWVKFMLIPLILFSLLFGVLIYRSRKKYKKKEKELNGGSDDEEIK